MHIREIVLANTHRDADRPVPFFCVADDKMHNPGYEEFWRLVADAMRLCGARTTVEGVPEFG